MEPVCVVVPVTSKFPETVTFPEKIAAPASEMSRVSAVIVEPPSTPLNIISLSLVADFITKSEVTRLNLPNSVPASFNITSAPSASKVISPPESIVKLPPSEIVEPLIVISSTVRVVSVPTLVIFVCAAVDKVPASSPLEP